MAVALHQRATTAREEGVGPVDAVYGNKATHSWSKTRATFRPYCTAVLDACNKQAASQPYART